MQRAQSHEVLAPCATLVSLFESRVAAAPEAIAYAFVRDDLALTDVLTYGALDQRVRHLAATLRRYAEPGATALLVHPAGIDFVCTFWACVFAGVVPVPTASLDVARLTSGVERLRSIADDAQAALVLCDQRSWSMLHEAGLHRATTMTWLATDATRIETLLSSETITARRQSDDVAYLQYTSGSTTSPRGVQISHANVLANCAALSDVQQPDATSRALSWLPHFHDYGLVQGILWPMFAGIPGYLMSPLTFLRRPLRWLDAIRQLGITHSGAPNFAYRACTAALRDHDGWHGALQDWRVAGCGAEPIDAATAHDFARLFAPHGLRPDAFTPAYGLAESTLVVSAKRPKTPYTRLSVCAESLANGRVTLSDAEHGVHVLVGCGAPVEGLTLRVIDPTTGKPCAADEVGELWIAGTSVGLGYHGHRVDHDGVFGQRLAETGDVQWLRSGDLGFLHDREVFVTGRLKDLLIVHGRNVYPQDVEAAVQRATQGLRVGHGAAFAIAGSHGEQVVVVQEVDRDVPADRWPTLVTEIRRTLGRNLELVAQRVVLVRHGSVARTSSGKVRRSRCRDDYLHGRLPVLLDDRSTAAAPSQPGDEPHDDTLSALLEAAARIVGRSRDSLSAEGSAIENGLDSLQCFRLLEWVQGETGVALPVRAVLGGDSLAALARLIDAERTTVELPDVDPDERRQADHAHALTLQQQGVWFADKIAGNGLYHLVQATRVVGALDAAHLQRALGQLVERHAALRLAIVERDGTPCQHLATDAAVPWQEIDLQALPSGERNDALQRQLQTLALQRVDLARAPLLQAVVWRLQRDVHVVALRVHHLVFDGWSAVVLMREWAALYGADPANNIALPAAAGYPSYLEWQRRWLASPHAQAQLTALRDHMADVPVLELPFDRPRPVQPTFRGAVVRFEIDTSRTSALHALATRNSATLFAVLMALFEVQLHRLSGGQKDFAIGTPAAARPPGTFTHTVGLFTNTLVLRATLEGDPTFSDLLARVRLEAVRALEHESIPFDRLAEVLHTQRDLRRNVLFQVGLALQSMGDTTLRLPGLACQPMPVHTGAARTDLWLTVVEQKGTLQAELEYATDLFDAASATRVAAQFERLVDAVLSDAATPISRLPMLGEHERQFLLERCNDTRRDYPLQWCLHELIERQARKTPQDDAVRCGDVVLGYADLVQRAHRLAHHLRARGVGPDQVVGVCLQRSPELLVALLAVLAAGGAYLPLDPELPAQRLAFMLQDANAKVVLAQTDLLEVVQVASAEVSAIAIDVHDAAWTSLADWAPERLATPDHLAYVIYTSGSTGEPKGVAVTHRAACNHKHWELECIGLSASHRVLQKTSIGFDASGFELLSPLLAGACVAMAPPGAQRDPRELVRTMQRHGISHLVMTPSAARALVAEPGFSQCTSLQHLLLGGEALDHDLVRAVRACLPGLRIGNFYGPSETTEDATHHEVIETPEGNGQVPIGRPIANLRCHVFDAGLQPVPIGVVGELYIGGEGLARGYLHRPELTAERFVGDPLRPGQRLYRTGDLARYRADGALQYVGRIDAQVKIRGQRIELGEIEATLRRCDGVQHAVVTARHSARGELELVAHVVAAPFDESALCAQLRLWLPPGLMPAFIVPLPALPRLASGKVDLRALPAPDPAQRARVIEAPCTATEQRLLDIWRELLAREPLGIDDNFFEHGGHSLMATRLVSRIRAQLSVDLPLRTVFEQPTVAGQARAIDAAIASSGAHTEAPIVPVPRSRPLPLSYSQQRMWLVQQMDPDGAAYNMPFAARVTGAIDRGALLTALGQLARRHEALRTSFQLDHDTPKQVIADQVDVPMHEADLSSLPASEREAQARVLAQREARAPFDLARPPLVRALLMRLAPQDHVLLIVLHHAVGDQWSGGVLARELAQAYRDARAGREPTWSPLRFQYADYAAWQREHLGAQALVDQLDHWRQQLSGVQLLSLPSRRDAAAPNASPGASIVRPMPSDTISAVQHLAQAHGATPFMVLLAAFKLVLSRYCGQTDIAVGTPIANRTRTDTEQLVGTMVNTLVMRTDLSGDPTFADLLDRVKETALQAYAHQDLPYEHLVDALRTDGDARSPAAINVLFNVPNAPFVAPELDGLTVEPFDFDRGAAQFDLALSIDTEHFQRMHFEFAAASFERSFVEQLAEHYLHLLQQAIARPKVALSQLSTLTPVERQRLRDCNLRTERALPSVRRVDELITLQAARSPRAVALSQGDRQLSYAEVERRVNRLAHHLRRCGVTRGSLVGLCLQRTPDLVVSLLAVLRAGAAYVPLDPLFPRDRLEYMVTDSGLTLVISHGAVAHPPAPSRDRVLDLDVKASAIATEPMTPPPCDADGSDLAYVLYTSGSTGRPKGVEIEHRSLVNFVASMQQRPGCQRDDILLAITTLSFDIAGLELLLPLTVGARVELATSEQAADPQLLIERLAAVRPTLMQATPTTWGMLLAAGWRGDPGLVALCGGEPLSAELAGRLLARCRALWNLYGPTETTIWSTLDSVRPDTPVTIGTPIANTSVWVLDATGEPVPPGVVGELAIGGLGVARGYRNRPDLTAERFVPDRLSGHEGAWLYRTGDLARALPDGRLVHMGRNDFQVKLRGFRIELGEVESALLRHASVAQCAVVVRDDATGTPQLVAYVVLLAKQRLDAAALRTHLRGQLPEYMVPTAFAALDALPTTANRKVDVKGLPPPTQHDRVKSNTDPHSVLAVQLLALWRRVLDDDELGLHDNFFDSGGHSLKAVQLLTLIERVFGRRLPLATLIEAPTVAQLEGVLSRDDWTPPWRSLVALAVHGDRAPMYLVPGVGGNVLVFTSLARLFDGERPVYGLQARGLDGKSTPFRSIQEMAAHYVAEIRSIQPVGPYLLIGSCTGGVVAYEMAQQLRSGSEVVELLMLETWHPSSFRPLSAGRRLTLLLRLAMKRSRATLRTLLRIPPNRWSSALKLLLQPAQEAEPPSEELLIGHDHLEERVVTATLQAVANYEARPYSGRLFNVIASQRKVPDGVVDTRHAWESLAREGTEAATLPVGGAGTMFWQPYVLDLANLIRGYLGARL